jgi:hypothetical protein
LASFALTGTALVVSPLLFAAPMWQLWASYRTECRGEQGLRVMAMQPWPSSVTVGCRHSQPVLVCRSNYHSALLPQPLSMSLCSQSMPIPWTPMPPPELLLRLSPYRSWPPKPSRDLVLEVEVRLPDTAGRVAGQRTPPRDALACRRLSSWPLPRAPCPRSADTSVKIRRCHLPVLALQGWQRVSASSPSATVA